MKFIRFFLNIRPYDDISFMVTTNESMSRPLKSKSRSEIMTIKQSLREFFSSLEYCDRGSINSDCQKWRIIFIISNSIWLYFVTKLLNFFNLSGSHGWVRIIQIFMMWKFYLNYRQSYFKNIYKLILSSTWSMCGNNYFIRCTIFSFFNSWQPLEC